MYGKMYSQVFRLFRSWKSAGYSASLSVTLVNGQETLQLTVPVSPTKQGASNHGLINAKKTKHKSPSQLKRQRLRRKCFGDTLYPEKAEVASDGCKSDTAVQCEQAVDHITQSTHSFSNSSLPTKNRLGTKGKGLAAWCQPHLHYQGVGRTEPNKSRKKFTQSSVRDYLTSSRAGKSTTRGRSRSIPRPADNDGQEKDKTDCTQSRVSVDLEKLL